MQRNIFPLHPLHGSYNCMVLQSSTNFNSQVCQQRLSHKKSKSPFLSSLVYAITRGYSGVDLTELLMKMKLANIKMY